MSRIWALTVVYCDTANNRILTLGGAAFRTKRERDANLSHIPTAATDSDYLLDVENSRGITNNLYLTPETVEALLLQPVAALIANAAEREAEVERQAAERHQHFKAGHIGLWERT